MPVTFKTFNENIDNFIDYSFNCLKDAGVDVIISRAAYVRYPSEKFKCNGYFYAEKDETPVFAFATGKSVKKWFPIFVHEFCHFKQWRECAPVWDALDEDDELWEWVESKKELKPRRITQLVNATKNLEHDCERRTLAMIREHDLPIDCERYAKSAAAYVLFYDYLKKHRKWYKMGKEPYRNEKVLKAMPANLPKRLKLTPKIEKLFKACCV